MDHYNLTLSCLPQGVTYSEQLTRLGTRMFGSHRYVGTFAADQIPLLKHHQSCIVNVSKSTSPDGGSHWLALVRGTGKRRYVYDSFARKGSSLIPSLKDAVNSDLSDFEQTPEEVNCGARCLAWLSVYYRLGVKKALSI